jgi:hypothetical protein
MLGLLPFLFLLTAQEGRLCSDRRFSEFNSGMRPFPPVGEALVV